MSDSVNHDDCATHAKLLYQQCIMHPNDCAYMIFQVMNSTNHAVRKGQVQCTAVEDRKKSCADLMNQFFYPHCIAQHNSKKRLTSLLDAISCAS